jgi:hypothetical protein
VELKTYVAQDATGAVIPGAQASLLVNGTDTLATGLVNASGVALPNPMTTDANGVITFKAPDGIYQLQFTLGPLIGPRFTIQFLDVEETIAAAQAIIDQGNATLVEVKSLITGKIYPNTATANADATLTAGSYYAIPEVNGTGAFTYYRKISSSLSTIVTTIASQAQVTAMQTALNDRLTIASFQIVIASSDPVNGDADLLYCVRDSKKFQTWLGVRKSDGGPSVHAERLIRERLRITERTNFMADGEEIAWAVTDRNGVLTDLAVRAVDGQLADYAVKRISERMLSSINKQIAAQLDPLTIGRDAPAFQVLASIGRWAAQRGRGESVSSPINLVTPQNTQNARLTFSNTPYNNDGPMLLIIYFGGVGSGPTLTPPPEYSTIYGDGIIWARCNFEGDHYGSPKCMQDVYDLFVLACKAAPVGGVLLLGNSMGGMGALNALLTKAIPGVLGLYLTDPVANLFDRYNSERQGLIQAAYGINANGDNYSTQTAGYDPVLRHWSDFRGAPVYCIASTGDNLVPYATNAKQLYDTFSGHLDFTLETHTTAGHNTADRFDPMALRTFIRKCTTGTILKG